MTATPPQDLSDIELVRAGDAVALGIPPPEYEECAICKQVKHESQMMKIQPICRACY